MTFNELHFSRRGLLQTGAAVAGTAGALGALTGCTESPSSNKPGGGEPKRGGTLTLALYGAAQSDQLDGQHAFSIWDLGMNYQLYNSGLELAPIDGDAKNGYEAVPGVIESAEYDGPRKLVLRVRDGVEFHHGKTLTAEDVLFSYRRIADPANPAPGAPSLGSVDLKNSRIRDARTIELVLSRPDYFLRDSLGNSFQRIYPTDWNLKQPVGTGPFKLKDFDPGKSVTFERFENYFDTAAWADQVVFQSYDDESALVNALTSGACNLLANVPTSQVKLLESNSRFTTSVTPTGAAMACFSMMKQTSPFSDERVREAFRLATDRQAIVDQVYGGRATVGNDLFNPFDAAYNSDLPQREHDPERAKSLLAEAGVSSLDLELGTGLFTPNVEVVFAQGLRDAGVNVNVKKVDQSTFYAKHYAQEPLFATAWPSAASLPEWFGLTTLPNSIYNETQENDSEISELYSQAEGNADANQRVELLKEMQAVLWERGGYIMPAFLDQVDATSSDVQGATTGTDGYPFGKFNMKSMWLA